MPQIVLIDARRTDALKTTAWLRAHHPSVKVLALCSKNELSQIQPLLDSGAAGYLLLIDLSSEINTAIHEVLTKGVYVRMPEPYRMQY